MVPEPTRTRPFHLMVSTGATISEESPSRFRTKSSLWKWVIGFQKATSHRDRHSLCPIPRSEFCQNALDATLYRLLGDIQDLCDLSIAHPLFYEFKYADLPSAQRFETAIARNLLSHFRVD